MDNLLAWAPFIAMAGTMFSVWYSMKRLRLDLTHRAQDEALRKRQEEATEIAWRATVDEKLKQVVNNGTSILVLDQRMDNVEDRVLVLESNDRMYLKLYQAAECDIRKLLQQVKTN